VISCLEQSEFYVADEPAILAGDPTVALYVAAILERRLDAANRWLVGVKRQLQTGEPPSVIGKAVEKVEELLSYGGRVPNWMVICANRGDQRPRGCALCCSRWACEPRLYGSGHGCPERRHRVQVVR
jgi:hypothetical protein